MTETVERCSDCDREWCMQYNRDTCSLLTIARLRAENATLRERGQQLEAQVSALDGRRREGRGLLRRMVKYVTEDRAETPGKTRLARLTEQVADYLNRTHEPRDILR